MSVVEDVRSEFKKVAPYLIEEFGVPGSEVEGQLPGIITKEKLVESLGQDPIGDDPIGYQSDFNTIVVNPDTLGEGKHTEVSPSVVGEETAHWLRTKVGNHYPWEEGQLGTGDVSLKDFMKSETVMEFIGRYAAINCSAEFGGELSGLEYDEWKVPKFFSSQNASKIRRNYWDKSYKDIHGATWNEAFVDRIAHRAGFEAAAELYQQVDNDEDILRKSTKEIWQEYGLGEYELDAIREVKDEGEFVEF